MFHLLNHWAGQIVSWAWTWAVALSYWGAVLGGVSCGMTYLVCGDKRLLSTITKLVILYIVIQGVDSVL